MTEAFHLACTAVPELSHQPTTETLAPLPGAASLSSSMQPLPLRPIGQRNLVDAGRGAPAMLAA